MKGDIMTPKEFARAMREIQPPGERGDAEIEHQNADALMCEVLKELGYEEGVEIFLGMTLWYA
jgi:hypothetical protein